MHRTTLRFDDLVAYFERQCKAESDLAIGLEYEHFVFSRKTKKRLTFQGLPGIQYILEEVSKHGWVPHWEAGKIVGLSNGQGASISLEPGGQYEYASRPHTSLPELFAELESFEALMDPILNVLDCVFVRCGTDPLTPREGRHFVPKQRYAIMKRIMPETGELGLDMMTHTCTIQASLDYTSEQDAADKMWIATALQPLVTALFASSPFLAGKTMPYASTRGYIWTQTDPQRCGVLPFAVGGTMRFEDYARYALHVPMYFIDRHHAYHMVHNHTFADFMEGRILGFAQEAATLDDWQLHLSTLFPDVRLKNVLEMRGADASPFREALPAFWVGALYDDRARDQLKALIDDWSVEDLRELVTQAYTHGLQATFKGQGLHVWAEKVLLIVQHALQRLPQWGGEHALHALEPLEWMIAHRTTLSDVLRSRWPRLNSEHLLPLADDLCHPERDFFSRIRA